MPVVNPPPASKAKTTRTFSAPKSKYAERLEGLEGYGQLGQAACIMLRQYADAGAIGLHAPKLADEIAKLADIDERVANFIDPVIQAGPFSGLATAVIMFGLQIGVNHGVLKPGGMGTVPAETLAARVEAGIAQMQAQAYREQMEAEQEAERLREEIRNARTVIPARPME